MAQDNPQPQPNSEHLAYDRESDVLEVYFDDRRRVWSIELTENIVIGIDREREQAMTLTLLDFSQLASTTAYGPRSFPVTGLAGLPALERELVLRVITSEPVSRWLDVSNVENLPDSPFCVAHFGGQALGLVERVSTVAQRA